jgi:hypothetical protein
MAWRSSSTETFGVEVAVILTKGQIAYMARFIGDESEPSLLLPPSPGASVFPIYVMIMVSASGAGTFNLAMHPMKEQARLLWRAFSTAR